jgi:hypothetical protein
MKVSMQSSFKDGCAKSIMETLGHSFVVKSDTVEEHRDTKCTGKGK